MFLAVQVVAAFGQIMARIIWGGCQGAWLGAHGVPADEIAQTIASEMAALLASPGGLIAFLYLPFQLTIALAAIIPALWSPEGMRARLGLVRPALPAWALPVVAVGLLVPFAMGAALASRLAPLAALLPHYDQPSWAGFALFLTVVPPFVEELFFRGYVQRRLLSRWSPWVAIPITSALFALSHGNLLQVCVTFLVGLWLGALAWRTGSVWPGMVCHAFWNGALQLWAFGTLYQIVPETVPLAVRVAASVLVAGCFLVSCYVLARRLEGVKPSPTVVPVPIVA
jgi:membrane protease YdiL (CAAX protease family)